MFAGELSGFWQKRNVRVDAAGVATGRCLASTGDAGPVDPIRFTVRPNCFVSGNSESGFFRFSLRMEQHKRGLSGRFVFDNGLDFFEGPVVAVKRGR
jgi:hypothetical protein